MSCPSPPPVLSSTADEGDLEEKIGSCTYCKIDFLSTQEFYHHLITHQPIVVLHKLHQRIILKINKDRLNQSSNDSKESKLHDTDIKFRKTFIKHPAKKLGPFEPVEERGTDSGEKPSLLKLTIKKSSSLGSPAFTVVATPSPPPTENHDYSDENFEKFTKSFMSEKEENYPEESEEVDENGIMSNEEDQEQDEEQMLVDNSYSSSEDNNQDAVAAAAGTTDSNPGSNEQNLEANGAEDESDSETTAKEENEDGDKKLIFNLTSKQEFEDEDGGEEIDDNYESKEGSVSGEEEMGFKNGIVKRNMDDVKEDDNSNHKDIEDVDKFEEFTNHKDGVTSESEEEGAKDGGSSHAFSPGTSSHSVNSAGNSNSNAGSPAGGCAEDSDRETNSEKDSDSKMSIESKPAMIKPQEGGGGGLRVRSSSEMLKSSISDFDTKDSDLFLGGDGNQSIPPIVREGLTILSAAQLGATENSSCDSDNLLRNMDYQNQLAPVTYNNYGMPNDSSVEFMPIDQLGAGDMCNYKCNLGPECGNILFMNAADLSAHQASVHNMVPPVQQLAQQFSGQVQRLQVPQPQPGMPPQGPPQYGMRGMPPSPQYRQGMPPQLAMKQGLGSPRYQNSPQSRFGGPQSIRPRMQMAGPVNGRGQPMIGRGGPVKRPGPSLGRGGSPLPQKRRYDTLQPSRLEDNDCHVIAMQKRNNDAGLVIQNVQGRDNNLFQLSDAITLSLRNQQPPKENPTKSVTNVLASRGITVTPSGGGKAPSVSPRRNSPTEAALTSLNLNSAISIISTNTSNNSPKQQTNSSGFAIPKGVVRTNVAERPPRPPTVDLTGGDAPQRAGRNQFTCQVCDKTYSSVDALNQHMVSHRTGTKLPFKCNLCNAQYPNQQALLQHKKSHHRDSGGAEMALPVVDLRQPGTLNRLQQLGVKFCIPLSQLGNQSGGIFGLPVISIDGAKNPAVCNLSALGASNILSLGPIKSLGR